MNRSLRFLLVWIMSLMLLFQVKAQNHSYALIYDQVYPLLAKGEYYASKTLFEDLHRMYTVDPSERFQFAYGAALRNGDVDYFKSEHVDLMRNYGYFFRYEDTLVNHSLVQLIRQHDLIDWLVEQTNLLYPKWAAENPDAFFIQQKILQLDEANDSRFYFQRMIETYEASGDSLALRETLKYQREFDFAQLYTIIEICRRSGFPNNYECGYNTWYKIQPILSNNMMDKFNFERTWHHIAPFLEKDYFDGKISTTFLKLYDKALEKHYGYQYYGTIDSVEVKDPQSLKERRATFKL